MLKLATELSSCIRDPFSTSAPLNHRWTIPWKHVVPPQGTSSVRVPRPPPPLPPPTLYTYSHFLQCRVLSSQPTNCAPLKTLCIPFRMLAPKSKCPKKGQISGFKTFQFPLKRSCSSVLRFHSLHPTGLHKILCVHKKHCTSVTVTHCWQQNHANTRINVMPSPMAWRSKARVCDRSLAWDCGFESRQWQERLSLVSVVCCQVEVSATGRSLVKGVPTDCCVSLCVI